MSHPLNTWISVKDAMPPELTPVDCDLIGMTVRGISHIIEDGIGGLISYDGYSYAVQASHWMLLSKPTNK